MSEEKHETFDGIYWSYNCPLQMQHSDDNDTWSVLNYMPRKEQVVYIDERVTKEELPVFCKNAARILRNLAELFDALGEGKIDTIYYPDEKVQDAISEKEEIGKEEAELKKVK